MSAKTEIINSIFKLVVSEYQAIGIYQAEVFWNNYPQETFKVILKDEKEHAENIRNNLTINACTYSKVIQIKIYFNLAFGWVIGTFLSCMPRKICFYFHVIAEKKAANEYKTLNEKLEKTTEREWKQGKQFSDLVNAMMKNEIIHSEYFICHSLVTPKPEFL
ncbi:MAG: hypothetical protein ACI8PD_000782 [Nitrospinales bacterium]|jgi:hypothetical protein